MPNTTRGDDAAPDARMSAALADRYRIEHELGEGGMATVYLAHDLKHDRSSHRHCRDGSPHRTGRRCNAVSGNTERR